jgi:hypothetical protein
LTPAPLSRLCRQAYTSGMGLDFLALLPRRSRGGWRP